MLEEKKCYIQILLKKCLKVKKNQPLLISGNVECIEFIRMVQKEAYEMGLKDVYIDLNDSYFKREALLHLKESDLKKSQFFTREVWNEYALKDAAFLILASEMPGVMDEVDSKLNNKMSMYMLETQKEFDLLRSKEKIAWCIAAVPTRLWAEEVFPDSKNALEKLWREVFKICGIYEEDAIKVFDDKIKKLQMMASNLNSWHFKFLKYRNELGTNFTIELPCKHVWKSGSEVLQNGREVVVNFPTEEIFTSPVYNSANGIVFASKPLSYNGTIINNFYLEFKNGKVVNYFAKEGNDALAEIVTSCKNSCYLGEVALVSYDSSISQSGVLFYETLYDENAACHLALGASFPECLENGINMSVGELQENGLNQCKNHVDFMIGTKDLSVVGVTEDGKEVPIFVDGNFSDDIKKESRKVKQK